jgi:molecular chaperone DnaJ
MSKRDYYEVLEINRGASEQELKSAYKRLAVRYHPDKNPGDHAAEEKFKEVAEAYAVLSNPEQRARYDRYGHAGVSSAGAPNWGAQGFGNIEDIFDLFGIGEMFGGRGGASGRRTNAQRGSDLRYDLEISLEEAAQGMTANLRIPRLEACDDCKGTGAQAGTQPEACAACAGTGQVRYQQGFFSVARTCGTCRGTGRVVKHPCNECRGAGRVEREKEMEVKIPAGVETGSRVRLPGQGGPGQRGGEPGDLYLRITVRDHPTVRVQGRDLLLDLPITPAEALAGAEVTAPTFEGPVKLKIPPGSQSGRKLRLRGRGLPALKGGTTGAPRGDLYVVLQIVLPPDSSAAREATATLQRLYKNDVRRDVVL